jgi:O-antigen/teichoic acid export membrane protein
MSKLKFIKNSIIYLCGSAISRSIPFLMLPVLTHYLSPEEYGTLSIFMIFNSILIAFIGMGLNSNITKNFHKKSKEDLGKIIFNTLIILGITFIIYCLICFLFTLKFDEVFSIPSYMLMILPVIAVMQILNKLNTAIIIQERRPKLFILIEVTSSIIIVFTTFIGISFLELSWFSRVIGNIVSGVIFSIIALLYIYKRGYIIIEFNLKKIKSILFFSFPLIPHMLGGIIIAVSDRFFIDQMIGTAALGIYSVGYTFGTIVAIFSESFIKAWTPWFYKTIQNPSKNERANIVKYTYIYIIVMFSLPIIISYTAKLIFPIFLNDTYSDAVKYVFWVSLSYSTRALYQIFFPYLINIGKSKFIATTNILAAIVNLILNYFFINHFGTIGAAYSTFCAFLISGLMLIIYQRKYYSMPWMLNLK